MRHFISLFFLYVLFVAFTVAPFVVTYIVSQADLDVSTTSSVLITVILSLLCWAVACEAYGDITAERRASR